MRTRTLQQIVYKIPTLAVRNSSRFRSPNLKLIHACQHHKIILSVNHFDKVCGVINDGKGCKYCQGYLLTELYELMDQGYRDDRHGKRIRCPRFR